jgi:hypothetical protein
LTNRYRCCSIGNRRQIRIINCKGPRPSPQFIYFLSLTNAAYAWNPAWYCTSVGASVSVPAFRSVVLLAAGGTVAGLPDVFLATEAGQALH